MIAGGKFVIYAWCRVTFSARAFTDHHVACLDGTLNVWSTNSNFARPDKSSENAHTKGTATTSVAFARDGWRLASRGGDDTVKRE